MQQNPTRTVIIDTDPGIDDAVAILLALKSAEFDVKGITTVAGNIGIATTTRNAGRILALEGRNDVPVIAGATGPLSRKGFDTADIHGNDGLGGVAFPDPLAAPAGNDAVAWLRETLDTADAGSIAILALGPLTNIARLVQEHPDAAKRIGRVIAMGGAVYEPGNIGPRSEFNIAADPEAAEIVFDAGLEMTLIPLDVTRKVRATRDDTAMLQNTGVPAAVASGALIDAYFQSTTGGESRPLHDPCVMLLALDEALFGCETLKLSVDTGTTRDAGALSVDETGSSVSVALKVESAAVLKLLYERLSAE
ncbi:nucleoside hydrolase [Mesorhizobium sp. ANAO-SY3R2]|uniref:nucleoside hydrolase n=1 Tax=Mesorhizobium sp. ANAO-SY3R2 TaxID=3166644 RepID=UPI00366C2C72